MEIMARKIGTIPVVIFHTYYQINLGTQDIEDDVPKTATLLIHVLPALRVAIASHGPYFDRGVWEVVGVVDRAGALEVCTSLDQSFPQVLLLAVHLVSAVITEWNQVTSAFLVNANHFPVYFARVLPLTFFRAGRELEGAVDTFIWKQRICVSYS